jgi:hypothetical protein
VHSAHRLDLKGESLRKLRAANASKLDEATANLTPFIPPVVRSATVAGFDWNRRLTSSESAP